MGDEADALFDIAFSEAMEMQEGCWRETTCRDCGSTNVYWAQENDLWVLYGTNSRRHKCDKRKLTRIRTDAFDSLD